MPGLFDDLAPDDGDAPKPPVEGGPFDDLASQLGAQPSLAVAVAGGLVTDPTRAGRILALQKRTRLPADLIDRHLDRIELDAKRADFDADAFRKASPAVAAWLAEQPAHAAVAQDDLPALAELEAVLRQGGRMGFDAHGRVQQLSADGATSQIYDSPAAFLPVYRDQQRATADRAGRARELRDRFGPLANVAAGAFQAFTSTLEAVNQQAVDPTRAVALDEVAQASVDLSPGILGGIQRGVGGVIADLPLMLVGGPLARLVPALSHLGRARRILQPALQAAAVSQPLAVREGILTGKKHGGWNGLAAWGIETAVPAAFGRSGAERAIIGNLGAEGSERLVSAGRRLLADTGLEASEEAATELAHALHEVAAGINPHALDREQLLPRLITAGAVGGLAGGAFNLPEFVSRLGDADGGTGGDLGGDIDRARQGRAWLERLGQVVATSQTLARHPDGLQAIVDKLKGGAPEAVHIDPTRWATYWQEQGRDPEQVAAEILGSPEAFLEAVATGAPMPIPMPQYVARLAGTEHHAALLDDLSLAPGALSAREAEARVADLTASPEQKRQAAADVAAATAEEPGGDPGERIRTDLVQQLTGAGVDQAAAESNAQLVAAGFVNLAQRAGMDPAALWDTYRLRVNRDLPGVLKPQQRTEVLDTLIARARAGDVPSEREINGPSLTEFLRGDGITDDALTGEVREIAESDARKPGQRSLVRAGGHSLDQAREAAIEAGYLSEGASVNDLLAAIGGEQRGAPVYRADQADPTLAGIRDAIEEVQRQLTRAGIDLANVDDATAKRAILGQLSAAPAEEPMAEAAQEFHQGAGPVEITTAGLLSSDNKLLREAVREHLSTLVDRDLALGDGTTARMSRQTVKKIVSEKSNRDLAVATYLEHILAVAQPVGSPEADSKGRPQIRAVQRYEAPIRVDGVDLVAGIRVWEMQDGRRVYSLNVLSHRGLLGGATGMPEGAVSALGSTEEATDSLSDEDLDGSGDRTLFQAAFHGTPHQFDRFTTDHMGSGEGNQAFGWGLYFAGRKEVAKFYRETLVSMRPVSVEALRAYFKPGRLVTGYAGFVDKVISFNESQGDWSVTVVAVNKEGEVTGRPRTHSTTPSDKEIKAILSKEAPDLLDRGRLYTVEIPEDGDYLLWDKPLSEQPEKVREAVIALHTSRGLRDPLASATPKDGQRVYQDLAYSFAPNPSDPTSGKAAMRTGGEAASKALLAAGVKGIKFLDGSSRANGEGSFNYVIFDGADVAIREYEQRAGAKLGSFRISRDRAASITLFRDADLSTFLHESGHLFLEVLGDVAERGDAPVEVQRDYGAVLKWFGVEDRGGIQTKHHEQFARGFERYLMEGKAPSSALRKAFASFKAWLSWIYQTLKQRRLDVQLTDEVRSVFDRMLASDEEIGMAWARQESAPAFATADEAGMTEAEFVRYRAAVDAAVEEAESGLRAQLMREYQREHSRQWDRQRRDVRADTAERINALPEHVAIAALQDGTLPDGTRLPDDLQGIKLNRAELVELYGAEALGKLPGPKGKDRANPNNQGRHVYASEGGMALQRAAQLFGFQDGDRLWEALVNAPDRTSRIEAETDQTMRRLFPDPMTDGTLADRAMAAIHGEKRGLALTLELDALAKRTGQRPAPIEVLRETARAAIASKPVRTLRPDRYETAERKAARTARAAIAQGDHRTAFIETQKQLLNHELHRAATKALEEVESARRYLLGMTDRPARERIGKAGGWEWTVTRPNGSTEVVDSEDTARAAVAQVPGSTWARTSSYLDQIDALLERFELKPIPLSQIARRERLADWVKRQEDDGLPVAVPAELLTDSQVVNWRQATVEDVTAVRDAVRNIEALARLKNRLAAEQRQRDLDLAVGSVVQSIMANGKRRPDKLETGIVDAAGDLVGGIFAMHRKLASLARQMDGGKDGGPVWDVIVRPINAAVDRETVMRERAAEALAKLFKAHGGNLGRKAVIPGIPEHLTLETRLAVALNWGNDGNRQRLIEGHLWDEGQVRQILDTLTDADWTLVEGIWKLVDSYWSEIAAKEQRVTGIAPEKVPASPFRLSNGRVIRGGYYPIKYDATKSPGVARQDAAQQAKDAMRGAIVRASTRRGHTKARLGAPMGTKLRLDLGVLPQHVNQVIHDLTHHELLIDLNRLLRHPDLAQTLLDYHGPAVVKQLDSAVADIAAGDVGAQNALEAGINWIRSGASVAVMGWNLMSAAQQVTGIGQSMVRVGPKWFALAASRMLRDGAHLEATGTWVDGKSAFMRMRGKTLLREVNEALNTARALNAADRGRQLATRTFYYFMARMQRLVDVPTWVAAYEKAMATGIDEAQAIAIADQTVIDTQGSGQIKDLAGVQRGNAALKLWTTFYSYFNTTFNLTAESLARTRFRDPVSVAKLGADLLLLYTFPVVLTYAIKTALRGGGEDDPEKLAKRLAKDHLSFAAGLLLGVRDIASAVEMGTGYDGPAGARGLTELAKGISATGDLVEDLAAGKNADSAERRLGRSALTSAGIFLHLPSAQILRILDGYAYAEQHHTGPLPVLFGPPPRAKR